MKKNANSRATLFVMVEAIFWISASVYARYLLDALVARWNLPAPWPLLLKIGVVLALIGLAITVHGLLARGLARLGWLPPEEAERGSHRGHSEHGEN